VYQIRRILSLLKGGGIHHGDYLCATSICSAELRPYDQSKVSNVDPIGQSMQDAEYDIRRIPLLRRWVNSVGCPQASLGEGKRSNYGGDPWMSAADDVDELIEQFHLAQGELIKGNPEPVKKLTSNRDDVTLANPLGPPAHGWDEVAAATDRAAAQFRDGENIGFEVIEKYVTPELAYVLRIERAKAKVGGREDVTSIALRATMIFRPEDGEWKVVHRHADPITTPQPAESVIRG
jgi:ketosteroid isomerase-like protein